MVLPVVMKHLRWIIFFALLICGHLPACLAKDEPLTDASAKKGVLDLRTLNLNGQPVNLNGEWRFYWRQLLWPGDSTFRTPDYVSYPSLWNKIKLHGQTLPVEGYATYSLTILLPKNRPHLTLLMPDVYCSYRLFINDSLSLAF
jgi:hypothetical protein